MSIDAHLKVLADASLAVGEAETALDAGEAVAAEAALDRAGDALARLRELWPAMAAGERDVVGRAAQPVRAQLDDARARLPRRRALSDAAPVVDPEQDTDPAA